MTIRALLISMLAAVCASSGAAWAQSDDEWIRLTLPEGWTVGAETEHEQIRLVQHVPAGQRVDDWTDMVMVITHVGGGAMDPTAAASSLVRSSQTSCAEIAITPPATGAINGRPVLAVVIACRDPVPIAAETVQLKRFEVTGAMVIQGEDNLYFVQRSWHGDEAEEALNALAARYAKTWAPFFRERVEYCEKGWFGESCGTLE